MHHYLIIGLLQFACLSMGSEVIKHPLKTAVETSELLDIFDQYIKSMLKNLESRVDAVEANQAKSRCLSGIQVVRGDPGGDTGGQYDIVQNVLFKERFDEIFFSPAFEKTPQVIISVTYVNMSKHRPANGTREREANEKPAADGRPEKEADEKFLMSDYKVEKLNEWHFVLHSLRYSRKGGWYIRDTEVSWMACA